MTKEKECTETNHADPDPDVLAQCCRGDLVASSWSLGERSFSLTSSPSSFKPLMQWRAGWKFHGGHIWNFAAGCISDRSHFGSLHFWPLHFALFALRTIAFQTIAFPIITLRNITFRELYTSDHYTSDNRTSDSTSAHSTSDHSISDHSTSDHRTRTIALRTTATQTTALQTPALQTTMSEQERIIHQCPFPLCTSRPFTRKHSLKNHLGAIIASGYDSKHPINSPLWASDSIRCTLAGRTRLHNHQPGERRRANRITYYRKHRETILERVKLRQQRVNAALKSIAGNTFFAISIDVWRFTSAYHRFDNVP